MTLHGLEEALNAVRTASAGSLKLSRTVAYALGDGDAVSRRSYELYGPDMHPPGNPKKGSGWLPVPYTEQLGAAGAPLPEGWELWSGVLRRGPFAIVEHPDHCIRETAATEPLARLAAVLRARIIEGQKAGAEFGDDDPEAFPEDDLEDMLS